MRKILLTTDGSLPALKSAEYIACLYSGISDLEIKLFHVSPSIPPIYLEESQDPLIRKKFAAWQLRREEEAAQYLDEARKVLKKGGVKDGQISTQYARQVMGVARDIIREGDAGKYDAIVIGKKGMGWFAEFFLGTISNRLLEIAENRPLWIVSGKELNCQKVLIAVDESKQALDLARYTGKMLQGQKDIEFLLYHFCTPFYEGLSEEEQKEMRMITENVIDEDKERIAPIFREAKKLLINFGFSKEAISTEFDFDPLFSDRKVSRAILTQAKEGNWGTVVLGRKGSTSAREFKLGSVTLRTVVEAENCAVWVV